MKILTNHLGYELNGPKRAVLQGTKNDQPGSFQLKRWETGAVLYEGQPVEIGPVAKWRNWHFWRLDFDPVKEEGQVFIECTTGEGPLRSFPFSLAENQLERNSLSDVVFYFKAQRCSGQIDKADRALQFLPPRPGTVDVHGGWYDASGDTGKHLSHLCYSNYFNPQQAPLTAWALLKTYDLLEKRNDANFREYKTRLLDEGLYGADYLVRIKDPAGSFYITVRRTEPENRPEDRRISKRMLDYSIASTTKKADFRMSASGEHKAYEAGYRSGGGIAIAALAKASTYGMGGDYGPADYLAVAESAFTFLEASNASFTNDGRENILDDSCALLAAVELFRATRMGSYFQVAKKRARHLMARLISNEEYRNYWCADEVDRPFFHASDAGLPLLSLLAYYDIANEADQPRVHAIVKKSLRFELKVTGEVPNPFGYSRQYVQDKAGHRRTSFFFPHHTEAAPWWQGENARLASLASVSRLALPLFEADPRFQDQLEAFATDQLNWILGLNPFDACMLEGTGRNNPEYLYFNSYAYANCPGGICNGITAGLRNEEDIDFLHPRSGHSASTTEDLDWRWGEQWLPHATWYLLAVAARDPYLPRS